MKFGVICSLAVVFLSQSALSQRRCLLPSETGRCRASIPKFYYDRNTKQCELFTYGGCGGNANRFDTLRECETTCVRNGVGRRGDRRFGFNRDTERLIDFVLNSRPGRRGGRRNRLSRREINSILDTIYRLDNRRGSRRGDRFDLVRNSNRRNTPLRRTILEALRRNNLRDRDNKRFNRNKFKGKSPSGSIPVDTTNDVKPVQIIFKSD